MKRAYTSCVFTALLGLGALEQKAWGQSTDSGFALPITLTGGTFYSERLQLATPDASPMAEGFRVMLYPTVKLGAHWFGYAALQMRERPYFYYDAFKSTREFQTDVIQAFAGYSFQADRASVVVKAGRLASAFGSFPMHYDDMQNPLLDQPLNYIATLTIRADQLPCGLADLEKQSYGFVGLHCGGAAGFGSGVTPVTLYGMPGAEADISAGRFDGRLQVTSGSPANPQPLSQAGDYAQWTAGGGYSIRQGFRVGVSGFRGPYLAQGVQPFLPTGTGLRDYPVTGLGTDVQWARGRWSLNGEMQRFVFHSPNFTTQPSVVIGYAEAKVIITPRFFLAGRVATLYTQEVADKSGDADGYFAPGQRSYEAGAGWWFGRGALLKGSYEWLKIEGQSGTRLNIVGAQFVYTLPTLSTSFKQK